MTYEELKIELDLYDPIDVLSSVGRQWRSKWFVVCNEGDCHLFKNDGTEDDIRKITALNANLIHKADIRKIIIPDSVTSIEDYAFWCCKKLTCISIPNSVLSIGESSFSGCSSLTNVMIPNSVEHISDGAFWCCKGLTSVTIPYSVTHIGFGTFTNCNKLKSFVFKEKTMDNVKAMDNYPFGIKDTSIITCI